MGIISKPNTFTGGTTAIAAQVNSNFDVIFNEFNGNIDSNNIKSGAAIADSKLAQISTAAKVSGTALTGLASIPSAAGTINNACIGTLTGSNINAGTGAGQTVVLDGSAKLPAVDGSQLTGINGLGDWVNKTSGYANVVAATDGFVIASMINPSGTVYVEGFTDSSNPPTTSRCVQKTAGLDGCIMFPVKKGHRWTVAFTGTLTPQVFWMPIGN